MDRINEAHSEHGRRNTAEESQLNHGEIAQLAYCYYLERGCEPGREDEDWRRAEEELRRRRSLSTSAASSRTVIGVFQSMEQAQSAFDSLTAEGFSRDEISLIANKAGAGEWTEPARPATSDMIVAGDKASSVAGDAGIGAAIGGIGGLLLSFAGLAIPGVGPVLAAGPMVAALGGAGIGAAAGGLIGVLTESGIPEEEAGAYAEGIRRGGILITVRAEGERANRAAEILDQHGAVDIDDRVSDWRTRGWTRHESGAPDLTADELRREREYFAAARRQGDKLSAMTGTAPVPGRSKGGRAPRQNKPAPEPRRSARIYGG